MIQGFWKNSSNPSFELGPEYLPEDKYFVLRSRLIHSCWQRGLSGLVIGFIVGKAVGARGFAMTGAGIGIGYTIAQFRPYFLHQEAH